MYEVHFGCPAKLDARQNTIVFAKADLDRPFLTHNADLFATVAPQLEAELKQALASRAIGEQVKGILKPLLAGRRPGIEDAARELRLSSRTLQRELAEDGATFQQLMQEARRELARHYLLHSSLELNEDRLPPGVRGRPLVLPGVPRLGGYPARRMARASLRSRPRPMAPAV